MRIELYQDGPVLELLSEMWVEAVPRVGEYFFYGDTIREVVEVLHNYETDIIRVTGREVY